MIVGCGKAEPGAAGRSNVMSGSAAPIQAVPATPAPVADTASIAIASFKGDHLRDCTAASVSFARPPQAAGSTITADQAAILLAEEALSAVDSGDGSMLVPGTGSQTWESKSKLTQIFAMLSRPDLLDHAGADAKLSGSAAKSKKDEAEVSAMLKVVQAAKWPFDNYKDEIKRGELAKVDSCSFPDRVSFGSCAIEDVLVVHEHLDPSKAKIVDLQWRIQRFNFDVNVADTDAPMKSCLLLGGKWTAKSSNDPDVARERLRQHAGQIRDKAGQLRDMIEPN
jgi:hypothetical protein